MKRIKEKSLKFMEIRDPAQSVGLWSYWGEYETTLIPQPPTKEAFGKFIAGDEARHATQKAAFEAMAKKGWKKSAARKMQEYAAQYLGERVDETGKGTWMEVPKWFRAWRHFAMWLVDIQKAVPDKDTRLSFGIACTGVDCGGPGYRSSRVIFLRKSGRYFVAVMMKEGWSYWKLIEKPAYKPEPYERLVLSTAHGAQWETVDAELITELLLDKNLCLFEMEKSPLFEAVTGEGNADQKIARFFRSVTFYVHDRGKSTERYYMRWGIEHNPTRSKYIACDRSMVRVAQVMTERNRDWVERSIELTDASKAVEAARWVVENNGCIVLPADASDELRMAASQALFYITFPDRAPDEPGGLLRGYQLPGRMVTVATKPIRYDGRGAFTERQKARAAEARERKRQLVVDTLLGRAVRVVAERNGLDEAETRRRIEGVGGRKIIETAAWRWGFMEGNILGLFTASPTAGALKLPDLSLALGFEHRLGLEGNAAKIGKLIQTARIRPLEDAVSAVRSSRNVVVAASRISKPRRGTTGKRVEFQPDSLRIVRDDGRFYLMAIDRHTQHYHGRDLLFEGGENAVSVEAFRFETDIATRSRQDMYVVREELDHNKMMAMAMDGRLHLYALDVRAVKGWFEATYTAANERPCRIVPTIPQLVVGKDGKADVKISFTVNPQLRRDGRKMEGRSWTSYTDAYPEEAGRNCVRWPSEENATLQEAMRKVVATDGVLLTDDEHLGEALEGMAYVVIHDDDPHAPGGAYSGYALQDRVFVAHICSEAGAYFAQSHSLARGVLALSKYAPAENMHRKHAVDKWRKAKIGKPLVEVIPKGSLKAAEKEFEAAIKGDKLADKKTAKFFTLEAPIEIGKEYKAMVAREFRRIVFTGTMGWRRQLIRPAHEVALGIWLARLRERD